MRARRSPEFEPLELVGLLIPCGEHDDRRPPALTNHAAQIESVLPRKHDVEQNQVRAERSHAGHRFVAVSHGRNLEAAERQVVREHARQRLVVFDDQDSFFHTEARDNATTTGLQTTPVLHVANCGSLEVGVTRKRCSTCLRCTARLTP
jgi:hypothetical protein